MDLKPRIPTGFRLPKLCYLAGDIYTNGFTLLGMFFLHGPIACRALYACFPPVRIHH